MRPEGTPPAPTGNLAFFLKTSATTGTRPALTCQRAETLAAPASAAFISPPGASLLHVALNEATE